MGLVAKSPAALVNVFRLFILITGSLVILQYIARQGLQNGFANRSPFQHIQQKLAAAYSIEGDGNFSSVSTEELDMSSDDVVASPSRLPAEASSLDAGDSAPDLLAPTLNFTFSPFPLHFCKNASRKTVFLLVIVHSAPGHFHNRQLVRDTWASSGWRDKQNFTVLFIVGQSVSLPVQRKVVEESRKYGDMVQHHFVDSYRNLTYKNLAGLSFLANKCPGGHFTYLLKTDDDMFVYARPIVTHLHRQTYCGRAITKTILCAEFVRKEIVQRKESSKWKIPWDLYGEKYYPPYCYGGGYILSSDMIHLLLEAAKKVAYYWIDDVYVTGFLAKEIAGVRHFQLPRQNPIRGYVCTPECRHKNSRWFIHTLQKVDLLSSYYRPVKKQGSLPDSPPTSCAN